jgi:hypothetical protein
VLQRAHLHQQALHTLIAGWEREFEMFGPGADAFAQQLTRSSAAIGRGFRRSALVRRGLSVVRGTIDLSCGAVLIYIGRAIDALGSFHLLTVRYSLILVL